MSTAMQVRLRHWPGMKVSWLGAGAVVHSGDEPSSGAAALVVSPHGSTECAVVISSHTVKLLPAMVEELAEVLANGLPRGFTAMRFVAWDGACATNERPAAAHMIAMRLGIDVIAAAGPLLGVPGGSLFAPIGRGEHRPGGFWRFRAGAQPHRVGWRFPAPNWEADLSAELPELPGDLVLDQIPAGLWLHRRRVGSVTDLAYSVPTDHAHPSLILSHPSEEPLQRDEVAQAVSAIPALGADRCVFTPYGQQPIADGPVGPVIADILGRAVHVRTGLPLCAPAGQRAVVTIDQKGLPRWRTFARELWHAPRTGAPRPVDWVNPCPDILDTPAGAATFTLGGGWVLEVMQAGLWIRPEHLADPADWIRGLPVDVNRCAVVIGAPYAAELTPPAHVIADVLEKLPVDARKRAYLAVPRGAAPNVFILATALRDSLPEPGEVELVSPSATTPTGALPASPTGSFQAGSFQAEHDGPRHGSNHPASSNHPANGRPFLVDGRPANGHPSGAHPTVSRPAPYDDPRNGHDSTGYDNTGYDTNGYETRGTAYDAPRPDYDEPRTSAFPESRTGGFAAQRDSRAPHEGRIPHEGRLPHESRDENFRGSRTGSFAPVDPATGSFTPVSPNGAHRPSGNRPGGPGSPLGPGSALGPGGHAADPAMPPGMQQSGPAGGPLNGSSNGRRPEAQRPADRPMDRPVDRQMDRPVDRPMEGTGAFPAVGGDYGYRGNPDATGPINGPLNGLGHGATVIPGNPNGAGHNGNGTNGHGANGHGHNGHGGNGNGHGSNGHPGMHPELHVAPPRTFHRENQPLPPTGPNGPNGYSFDAPDYDEHHFDLPTPPSRHHDEPTGRMPAQRMPLHDEQDDPNAEDTSSVNTGREIRSHSKKGKTTRTDDKTSTQELDRLLGFFDEIRRAKAWDEDPNSPDEQAAKRAASGKPPAGPRRARH